MNHARIEQFRFEPTVFGAVRRYGTMVIAVALITAALAVGYTLVQTEDYRADATFTVPQALLSQGQGSDQYLASQVLLLQSPEVAERAVRIANGALDSDVLDERDFSGADRSLKVVPPEGATPGSYESTIVAVSFTWPDATVAQVGVNALLQAFDDVRSAAITAQGEATVAGIERAINDARTQGQRTDLLNQRTEVLVNQEVDLARHPTVAWAVKPQHPINGNSKNAAAIGLLIGAILGAALAFARASRRRCFEDRLDPSTLYGAPLIGEIPASGMEQALASGIAGAGPLPMTADPDSTVAEAFRFAAGSVERIRAARGPRLSLTFTSTVADARNSAVVANVALAIAESGTRVLVVDADATDGDLTALLLPDSRTTDGFEQVLAGKCAAAKCIEPSPLHEGVAVLGAGTTTSHRVTGAAYSKSVARVLAEAKESFDVVLIDSPALLQVADATELVDASDGAIIVLGPDEPIRDHLDLADRLNLTGSEVVGYIYKRAPKRSSHLGQYLRDHLATRSARFARPTAPPVSPESPRSPVVPRSPDFNGTRPVDGDGRQSPAPRARR